MLTVIPFPYSSRAAGRKALTAFRKRYRVALRGAVVVAQYERGDFYIAAPLGGTGFSSAEFASALRGLHK